MKKQKNSGLITGFHITTLNAFKEIKENGFKVGQEGRFGGGVYFFTNKEEARAYNNSGVIIKVLISKEGVAFLGYNELQRMFSDLEICWDEEEGVPELKEWSINNGYQGCLITYDDGGSELVIYDLSLIEIVD